MRYSEETKATVLKLAAEGQTKAAIAAQTGVSQRSVYGWLHEQREQKVQSQPQTNTQDTANEPEIDAAHEEIELEPTAVHVKSGGGGGIVLALVIGGIVLALVVSSITSQRKNIAPGPASAQQQEPTVSLNGARPFRWATIPSHEG